jgi:hypothetical protein
MTYLPIFDFADETTVNRFERIDDAIMGGISLSSLKQSPNESFARWSGICRLDGGYVLCCWKGATSSIVSIGSRLIWVLVPFAL